MSAAAGDFPLTLETKRIAPGEMNTWRMRVVGMDGGVEFSTRYPQSLKVMTVRDGQQVWEERMAGSQSAQPTITGPIFEFGFTDALLQMWAAYFAERAGELGDAFGCATPGEALASHELVRYRPAVESDAAGRAVRFRIEAAAPVDRRWRCDRPVAIATFIGTRIGTHIVGGPADPLNRKGFRDVQSSGATESIEMNSAENFIPQARISECRTVIKP